jgi:hypothetical protein
MDSRLITNSEEKLLSKISQVWVMTNGIFKHQNTINILFDAVYDFEVFAIQAHIIKGVKA